MTVMTVCVTGCVPSAVRGTVTGNVDLCCDLYLTCLECIVWQLHEVHEQCSMHMHCTLASSQGRAGCL